MPGPRGQNEARIGGQTQVGDVVHDADGEASARRLATQHSRQLGEDGGGVARRELLRAQTVASTDDAVGTGAVLGQRGDRVEVQRLTQCTRLLDPVEHGDALHGFGQRGHEGLRGERPEQPDGEHADLLTGCDQLVDGATDGIGARTHDHHDPFRVGRTVVLDQVVAAAGEGSELLELGGHDAGHGLVVRVRRFASLEEDVRILRGSPQHRRCRAHRPRPMSQHGIGVDEGEQVRVRQHPNPVHLVAGPEAVEKVQERHPRLERRRVRDRGHVVGLLDAVGRQDRPAGDAGGHHVGVIAEDAQRMSRHRTGRDVQHRRRQLAGDLVHVRQHQQQTLRTGEAATQRAGLDRAVERPGRAGLRLHLDHPRHGAPDIRTPLCAPHIGQLAHRRRRRDRVDRTDVAESVRHGGRSLVAVDAGPLPDEVGLGFGQVGVIAELSRCDDCGHGVLLGCPVQYQPAKRQLQPNGERTPLGCSARRSLVLPTRTEWSLADLSVRIRVQSLGASSLRLWGLPAAVSDQGLAGEEDTRHDAGRLAPKTVGSARGEPCGYRPMRGSGSRMWWPSKTPKLGQERTSAWLCGLKLSGHSRMMMAVFPLAR